MKKVIISGIALALSAPALALHNFDCSNASGSVKVVESEIWGANPVGCQYKGEVVKDGKVTLFRKTKVSIQLDGDKKRTLGGDWEETFVIQAKLESKKGLPEPVLARRDVRGHVASLPREIDLRARFRGRVHSLRRRV